MTQPAKLMVAIVEVISRVACAELSGSTVLVSLSLKPYRHHAIDRVEHPKLPGGIMLVSLSLMSHPNLPVK
jgi:hypothetical protein